MHKIVAAMMVCFVVSGAAGCSIYRQLTNPVQVREEVQPSFEVSEPQASAPATPPNRKPTGDAYSTKISD